ncbi:GNAT family N-acetyltransferase [Arthrobacter sp. NPDC090010]|uniref:GNAT family N-acetyltransferase n=1 Tax=Arthrobacter sp. NPDC090010 TaxID=3363942 RepID=UPI00380A5F90
MTDGVTFGWLCDVYIAREARGRGLGRQLSQTIVDVVRPLGLKRFMLSTLDAHELYSKAGFIPLPEPEKLMVLDDLEAAQRS